MEGRRGTTKHSETERHLSTSAKPWSFLIVFFLFVGNGVYPYAGQRAERRFHKSEQDKTYLAQDPRDMTSQISL